MTAVADAVDDPTANEPTGEPPVHMNAAEPDLTVLPSLDEAVAAACGRIAPLWPLERFVAVNPYLGLTDHTFAEAAERLARTAGARSTMPAAYYLALVDAGRITTIDLEHALARCGEASTNVAAFLDRVRTAGDANERAGTRVPTVARVATSATRKDWTSFTIDRLSGWAAAYFDDGQALWRSADATQPLFTAWLDEARIDRTPDVMGLKGFRAAVRSLPADARAVTELAVGELGVPAEQLEVYLHAVLLQLGGWSAHAARIVWDAGLYGREDDTLVDWLAVLLAWELCLARALDAKGVGPAWRDAIEDLVVLDLGPETDTALADLVVLQDAFDRAQQRELIEQFATRPEVPAAERRPSTQAVFCIDVRSEVFRRHLESVAPDVDTIGFAGFFGFPIEYLPLAHESGEAQCPVLLTPAATVVETVEDPARYTEAVEARRLKHHVRKSWKSFKMGAISCFSFVGPVGLLYLPKMFTDAYGRSRPVPRPEDEGLPAWARSTMTPSLDAVGSSLANGIDLEQRVQLAQGALTAMSMKSGFAPIVLITGHGATTVNNPYDTGLDCGACGGHTGEANARVAAAILNDPQVRDVLRGRNIDIPADTWFVAGQHNTTTDVVSIFDREHVPHSHAAALTELESQLAAAGRRARAERAPRMGVAASATDAIDAAVIGRSADWAQVRPEWGLAGCRAFVVAPRAHTQTLDLGGRSFLHSYAWRQDEGFGVLELIMTAPMVVASWISLQYFASTVDNDRFGSGNKVLHNVVGRLGVLEGNGGDLRVGLPWQSVHDGEQYQHEPLRLNVMIEAPIDAMNDVLAKHDGVRDLLDNGWLQLLALDDDGHVSHRYVGALEWEPVAE